MGVYIKGMEKPSDCDSCNIGVKIGCMLWCDANKGEVHKDCPIVSVKTPHGKLIDVDTLEGKVYHEAFEDAPIVIESEVE